MRETLFTFSLRMDISTTTTKEREEVKGQILSNAWRFDIYSVTVSSTGGHMSATIYKRLGVLWDNGIPASLPKSKFQN